MSFDNEYVEQLERLIIETLLPTYNNYYTLTGESKPELDALIIKRLERKQCALFKPKRNEIPFQRF